MTDRPYATWPMKSGIGSYAGTDTRVGRTAPARLSDIVNVLDWGALGDGAQEDSTYIQNAIDFCISRGGGTVFFPPGTYKCAAAGLAVGTNNIGESTNGVQLIGNGGGAGDNTAIQAGNFWAISKGSRTYDLIQRVEGFGIVGLGGIKVEGDAVIIKNCKLDLNLVGIDASAANGCSITDCGGGGGDGVDADASGPKVFSSTGVGIFLGNNCIVSNCRLMGGYFITYALSGTGAAIMGGVSTERTYTACRVGWAPDPALTSTLGAPGMEAEAIACTVTGLQTERQDITLELYNARGCLVTGCILTGGFGQSNQQGLSLSWSSSSGGTVTATTAANHNLPTGTTWALVDANAGLTWNPAGGGPILITKLAANTFTYPLAISPSPTTTTGTWAYSPLYTIRVRKARECVIAANQVTNNSAIASVDLDYGGAAVHSNNIFLGTNAGHGWIAPVGENAAGWTFGGAGSISVSSGAVNNPGGNLTFNKLPGQFTQTFDSNGYANFQSGPYEGQEFSIKDGAKSGGGAAVWGDTVQGSSSGKYKVRYDGSVWKRIG